MDQQTNDLGVVETLSLVSSEAFQYAIDSHHIKRLPLELINLFGNSIELAELLFVVFADLYGLPSLLADNRLYVFSAEMSANSIALVFKIFLHFTI